MNQAVQQVKPVVATTAAVVSTGSQLGVALDYVHGWAAVITVLIGIPTSIMIAVYWGIKLRKAWKHRDDDVDI